jgi:hypothetical protein
MSGSAYGGGPGLKTPWSTNCFVSIFHLLFLENTLYNLSASSSDWFQREQSDSYSFWSFSGQKRRSIFLDWPIKTEIGLILILYLDQ